MTKEQLRDHILRQLGIIGAGESPTADDASLCETVIDNCHEELEQLEVATWSLEDIPGYAVESLVQYIMPSLTAFGQEYDPRRKELGLRQLRMVTADRRSGVGKACYF